MRTTTLLLLSLALFGFYSASAVKVSSRAIVDQPLSGDIVNRPHTTQDYIVGTDTLFSCTGPIEEEYFAYYRNFGTCKCGTTHFLARFGKEDFVTADYPTPQTHRGVIIRGRLLRTDNWNEANFFVTVGTEKKHPVLEVKESGKLCGSPTIQDSVSDLFVAFNHTEAILDLKLSSDLEKTECEASWGICDLSITLTACPITSTGDCIDYPYHACWGVLQEAEWTYVDRFRRTTCGDDQFLARYGRGRRVASHTFSWTDYFTTGHRTFLEARGARGVRGVEIDLSIAFLNAWGPNDVFQVTANNAIVVSVPFPAGAPTKTCERNTAATILENVHLGFSWTANTDLVLGFTSNLDTDPDTETAWGICGLHVTPRDCRLKCTGGACECVVLLPWIWSHYTDIDMSFQDWSLIRGGVNTTLTTAEHYIPWGQRNIFGPFGIDDVAIRHFTGLLEHQSVTLRYRVYSIDHWQDEETFVRVAGDIIPGTTQAFNYKSDNRAKQTGNPDYLDEYKNFEVSFPHTASELNIEFGSTLRTADATWALSDVVIIVNPCPVGQTPNQWLDECEPIQTRAGADGGQSNLYGMLNAHGEFFEHESADDNIFLRYQGIGRGGVNGGNGNGGINAG